MRGKKIHRLLSILLVVVMLLSALPMTALAEGDEGVSAASLTMGTKPEDGTTTGNPFVKGIGDSNSFRIPAMVTLNDGTIVAAADARWNTTYDGGGLDTIVSYSTDNGANWNYTFANYLGDNGNTYNGSSSTAFIDPALATDGETVYMLCDLYPYGVALNGSGNTAPSTAVGFNSDGTLKLAASGSSTYNYYLKDGQIYDSSNNVVSGYTVDAYFNITGNGYDTNLFFSDSPYQVVRTGYLYLTKSTDGGKIWSEPTLIPNVKTSSEQVCLVGPGRGLVTNVNNVKTIIFPVYSYNGSSSQQMGFIYSSDGGATWTRSANFTGDSWSSESAVVELSDGTLRFFYRNGNSKLYYADYTWGTGWGRAVNTGIATNSNTQISAITYSKTVNGKQVILVSCPTGSGSSGSNSSSASARLNGKIFVGLVNSDNTMDWSTGTSVSLTSQHSSTNYFMYSCLTELSDGIIAILYEDNESAWGTGDNYYYQMSYSTIAASSFGLTFDAEVNTDTFYDDDTNVEVSIVSESTDTYEGWAMTVAPNQTVSGVNTDYLAYRIALSDADKVEQTVSSATVTLPVGSLSTTNGLYAFVVNADGTVTKVDGALDGTTYTFTADLPAVVGLAENDATAANTEYITLTVGESQTVTDDTGNYSNSYTGAGLDTSKATVTVSGSDTSTDGSYAKATSITSGKQYLITIDGNHVVTNTASTNGRSDYGYWSGASGLYIESVSGFAYGNNLEQYLWTITESDSGYTVQNANGKYLTIGSGNNNVTLSDTAQVLTITDNGDTFYFSNGNYYLNNFGGSDYDLFASSWQNGTSGWTLYEYTPGTTAGTTTIIFTGVSAGTTSVSVGDTLYLITVNRKTQAVSLAVDGTVTYADASTSTPVVGNSTVATATLSNGTLTITGVAEGTTTITTDTTVYTVTVSEGTPISIKENETTTISVTLEDGQTVEWSSSDSSYVGVAGKYNTTAGAYTNEAILAGQNVTSSPVVVTATIKDAGGNEVRTEKWLVTVTEGDEDTNTDSRYIYVNVTEILNCTVYYSINGGDLIKINGTGVLIDEQTSGHFNIMFFAAPDEGYALTYMCVTGSGNQYYTLSDGNPDGTGSGAWPFSDANASTIPGTSGDPAWKTDHGFRWALLEGNMTIDQMKVLFSNALALGCDGATNFTKNAAQSFYTEVQFVAQPLPTIEKKVTSITRNGTEISTSEKVKIGDTINYTITITKPAYLTGKVWNNNTYISTSPITDSNTPTYSSGSYGTITYDSESLTDTLTNNEGISNPDLGDSDSSAKTYTYTTSLTLTQENFGTVVTNSTITNEVEFQYTYKSSYSTGIIDAKSSAVVDVTVDIPIYVVDFGLPLEVNLTGSTSGAGSITDVKNGQYGIAEVNAEGTGFTYTPTKVIQDVDYVEFTYQFTGSEANYSYQVAIYPASNVLYEDSFLEEKESTTYKAWDRTPNKTTTSTQSADKATDDKLFGYDTAYETSTGNSDNSAWTVSNLVNGTGSKYLTTSFYGNGFDLIGTAGPDTGMVYLIFQGPQNRLVVIDTSYVDGEGTTLYQVPLAHEMLTEGDYTVNIRAAYRAATTANSSTTASYSARSVMSASGNALNDVYAMIDELFMDGFEIDDVEFVYFDESSPLAELENATSAVSTFALEPEGATTYGTTSTTTDRPAGTTVTIDGFRVYRNSNNTVYIESEQNVTYTNVLEAELSGGGTFKAYVENSEGDWTPRSNDDNDYEANGGPQNEVYLSSSDAIAFKVGTSTTTVQISARAVGTDPVNLTVNGTSVATISSNTEMYYKVTSNDTGIITITTTGNGLLALGNLKLPAGTNTQTMSEDDVAVVYNLLRMMPASEEPDPVFAPEKLDVQVKSLGLLRNKLVTVTVTASTDVAKLTVNGKEVKPTNSLLVKYGLSKNYIFVISETMKKTETKDYVIVAYDANGVASEPVTVQG